MFVASQKIARTLIVLVSAFFTIFFLAAAWFVFGVHKESRFTPPQLSFWMEHAWSEGTLKDFSLLHSQLQKVNASDLYFHVGPLSPEGQLADDLNIFKPGMDALDTENYAWIGQVRSEIDLENPEVRQGIINSSKWLMTQGFDGIHVDIEPVRPDDEAFYLLLEEMRLALPGVKLSVAMDEWQPHAISQIVATLFERKIESYWHSEQVRRVAASVDQMVVMTYDTTFHDPALYTWWVEQQTIALSKTLPEGKELYIGIPAYEEGVDPLAENIRTGLEGYARGLTNLRSKAGKITGVAVYPYWELDDEEWNLLEAL